MIQLFEWLPEARKLFTRGIRAQGKMLANVIKFIVENIGVNEKEFKSNLTMLAKVHNGRGITANHYSVMGMTLIHSIRFCIGENQFTEQHRHAWIVVYSRMMIVMIPVVVSGETIDSDYLVAKADEARASQSMPRRPAWIVDEPSACPISGNSRTNSGSGRKSQISQCPNSRKGSSRLKDTDLDTGRGCPSPGHLESPADTPGHRNKSLAKNPSSRTSVTAIVAMASSGSDSDSEL